MNKSYITFIFVSCFLIGCQTQDSKSNLDDYKILNIYVEKFGKELKLPPPPPDNVSNSIHVDNDTVKKQKRTVAIYPILSDPYDGVEAKHISENFKEVYQEGKLLNFENIKVDLDKFQKNEHLNLVIGDTAKMETDSFYIEKNYDVLLYFSNIIYNESRTLAILSIGLTRGRLNGASGIAFLKKINGIWKEVDFKELTIS